MHKSESEEQLTPVTLRTLFLGLCSRAQTAGQAGDWDAAWAASEAAQGIERKMDLALSVRGEEKAS
jgi:hypothetical protein